MLSILLKLFLLGVFLYMVTVHLLARFLEGYRHRRPAKPGKLLYRYAAGYLAMLSFALISVFIFPLRRLLLKLGVTVDDLPPEEGDAPAVLLVHGYLTTASHWIFFRRFLALQGFKHSHAFSYRTVKGNIDHWSDELAELCRRYKKRGVVIVGHSLGGVVGVHTAWKLKEEMPVKVITLASPLYGTEMARVAVTPNAKHLLPEADEVVQTRRIVETGALDLHCFWSDADRIIIPPESGAPAAAKSVVRLEGVSHAGWFFLNLDIRRTVYGVREPDGGPVRLP